VTKLALSVIDVAAYELGHAMLIYLEGKKEIAAAQKKMEATIRREFSRKAVRDLGYPGGRVQDAEVATNGKYWFWSDDVEPEAANPRRLNWFGHFHERAGSGIVVEINTAYEGRSGQAAGFFARESNSGTVYLMHSGRIGGGQKGVGQDAFRAWYGEPLAEVADSSGAIREGFRVMPIDGVAATRPMTRYIQAVSDFKRAVRSGELATPAFQKRLGNFRNFYAEARGRRKGRRAREIDYVTRHGDIVDALKEWRLSLVMPKRSRIIKSLLIDMGVAVGDDLVEVFEVKPDARRPSFYSALGQLMVHASTTRCRKVMVLPHGQKLPRDCSMALSRWGVELLTFKLTEDEAMIVDPDGEAWKK
jgi:hypothetical protein